MRLHVTSRSRAGPGVVVSRDTLVGVGLLVTTVVVSLLIQVQRQAQHARRAEYAARMAAEQQLIQAAADQERTALQPGPKKRGYLRLIAGRPYQNIAIARSESVLGHPLHRIVVHFAGPEIPARAWEQSRGSVWGPILVPSPLQQPELPSHPEPVASESLGQLDASLKSSSAWFDGPGECQLQFALPDEPLAAAASKQLNEGLANLLAL
jgi:hypothetical protein